MQDIDKQVQHGIEHLNKLLALQSAQDCVERSPVDTFGPSDEFASKVRETAMLLMTAKHAIPLSNKLADIGRELEGKGLLKVEYGDSLADAALAYLLNK
ncbi:hypothetical protein [Diaphorobacter caeni]|uniref:hypothetical protein n=1 Tax=Diaphorobacter caeni TaxID=2784387 RepID=UPI00188F14EC|nr:hypothetical protein [Diaphorobacter caeni]MBF5007822.1 hypothetical protein [Diaphorobacter caeni]